MSISPTKTNRDKQAGMVAIMVTMILMIVISLIVLGFAQISRRNQRQAVDRQLSTQAFYAAETGINDAAKLIKEAVQRGDAIATKPDCDSDGGGFYATLNPSIDAAAEVKYTCLLVDPTPSSLSYGSVGIRSTVVPLIAASGNISRIELSWEPNDSSASPAAACPVNTSGVFLPTGSWNCGYGVMRFDLVPTAGNSLSISSLQSNTMTTFLVPLRPGSGGPTSVPYTINGGNSRLGRECSNTGCSFAIDGNLGQSQYYMRISSIYKEALSLRIRALDSAGNPLRLQGAQALVDATGKAEDVLRRVQVRIPLTNSSTNLLSDYAIQSSEAICKRFSVMDGFFRSSADTDLTNAGYPGLAASTDNPLCD